MNFERSSQDGGCRLRATMFFRASSPLSGRQHVAQGKSAQPWVRMRRWSASPRSGRQTFRIICRPLGGLALFGFPHTQGSRTRPGLHAVAHCAGSGGSASRILGLEESPWATCSRRLRGLNLEIRLDWPEGRKTDAPRSQQPAYRTRIVGGDLDHCASHNPGRDKPCPYTNVTSV